LRVEEVRRVAVVGAGSMGHGIAELFALHGYEVELVDLHQGILREALRKIGKSLRMIEGTEGREEEILGRIHPTVNLGEAVGRADFVLEAITEKMDLKEELFKKMDRLLPHHTVLSTNSSCLSVTRLAKATSRPERVVGTHFLHFPQHVDGFAPPQFTILLPLVEVVRTEHVEEEALELAKELMRRIGKVPEEVKDTPAFVGNRILARLGLEAGRAVGEGFNTYEIDAACLYGLEMPLGIFQMLDTIGLDVAVYVSEYLEKTLGSEYRPPEVLWMMVEQGYLGQKSGKGFYDYSQGPPEIMREDWRDFDPLRLLAPMVNEACRMIEQGIADGRKIERVLELSFMPAGFLTLAERFGVEKAREKLRGLAKENRICEPCPLLRNLGSFSELLQA
jgi:enoyl-CoA hydratase/3-hydroxyacyl-CoA dehydrogenase